MSFRISIPPRRRAALRLLSSVRHQLVTALAEEAEANGLTQADIAREMDVNRSVVSRFLSGSRDMLLGSFAEMAWALDREISVTIGPAKSGIKAQDIAAEAKPAAVLLVPQMAAEKHGPSAFKLAGSVSDVTTSARPTGTARTSFSETTLSGTSAE